MVRHLHLKNGVYTTPGQESLTIGRTRVLPSRVTAWSVGGTAYGIDNPWV